ncbi:peptide chain release factor N(5)-glutamine methyltransferase [Chloroflexota bacterium]
MTLRETLGDARSVLATNKREDAPLECELLLRHILKLNRVAFYLDLDKELPPDAERDFWHLARRHFNGEPTAYITGHREFYGIDFYVDQRVLIPRPESELLVEKALTLAINHDIASIADIGTGCGTIAVSLALNLPEVKIYASDISASALEVALLNCQKQGQTDRIRLLQGDMLTPLTEPVDLIIANLPYVKEAEIGAASCEPRLALDGGRDGLDKIRRLCHQLNGKLLPGGHLLLEIGQGQATSVVALLHDLFPGAESEVTPDLGGIDRVISLKMPAAII